MQPFSFCFSSPSCCFIVYVLVDCTRQLFFKERNFIGDGVGDDGDYLPKSGRGSAFGSVRLALAEIVFPLLRCGMTQIVSKRTC